MRRGKGESDILFSRGFIRFGRGSKYFRRRGSGRIRGSITFRRARGLFGGWVRGSVGGYDLNWNNMVGVWEVFGDELLFWRCIPR